MHWFQTVFLTAILIAASPVTTTASGDNASALHSDKTTADINVRVSDLDGLVQTSFTTTTPWHSEPAQFTGVLLKDFLDAKQIKASKLRFVALNDYIVESNVDEMIRGGALLATRANDQPLQISEKGPVLIIFNFDGNTSLKNPVYFARSVWQLDKIEILE